MNDDKDKIKKLETIIILLIGAVLVLMFLGSNPKSDTAEWSGVSHQGL